MLREVVPKDRNGRGGAGAPLKVTLTPSKRTNGAGRKEDNPGANNKSDKGWEGPQVPIMTTVKVFIGRN